MRILRGIYWRMQLWLVDQMRLSGRSSKTYRSVYDDDISKEGVEFQVKTFYEISDKARRRRLEVLLDVLSPCEEDSILDVGCGVGTFAFYSAKAGAQAIGVDYSVEAIKMARLLSERHESSTDPLFLVADATKLPFKGTLFNKVICADFIEHVSDIEKEKVLDEIMRVLNSGTIIIYTPNYVREVIGFLFNYIKSLLTHEKVPVNPRHFGLTTRVRFENMLRKYNSTFICFKYIDETRPYLGKIPLLRRLLALNLLWKIIKY